MLGHVLLKDVFLLLEKKSIFVVRQKSIFVVRKNAGYDQKNIIS